MEYVPKKAGRFFDPEERLPFGGRKQVGWVKDVITEQSHQRNVTKERIKDLGQRFLLANGGKWRTLSRLKVVAAFGLYGGRGEGG